MVGGRSGLLSGTESGAEQLVVGHQYRTQDSLSVGSQPGPIAAPDLAIHDSWPNGLLRSEVRRVDVLMSQDVNHSPRCFRKCFANRP